MARSGNDKDKDTYASYPKDAYDTPPAGPVGVHRGARSVGARALPFVIVLIVAVLAGLAFWAVFSGQAARVLSGGDSVSSSTTTATATASATSQSATASHTEEASQTPEETASEEPSHSETPSQSPSESASPSETPSETPSAQVNYSTAVSVINGTGTTGYAAQEAAKLQAAGFTSVTPSNPSGTLPSASVVWYSSPDDEATAKEVANALGIADVQQANIATPVMAVLMN